MFLHLNLKIKQNSIFLNPTNPDEISEITKKLKGSNSSGIDNISTKLLKSIINEIAPVLSHIFNRSLLTGIVPSQLKLLKLTLFLNQMIIKFLVIIGQFQYYHPSLKFLKKLRIIGSLIL